MIFPPLIVVEVIVLDTDTFVRIIVVAFDPIVCEPKYKVEPLKYKSFQRLVGVPKSYVIFALGTKAEVTKLATFKLLVRTLPDKFAFPVVIVLAKFNTKGVL